MNKKEPMRLYAELRAIEFGLELLDCHDIHLMSYRAVDEAMKHLVQSLQKNPDQVLVGRHSSGAVLAVQLKQIQ